MNHTDGRFAGERVVVTGATSGIGRAVAERFAREGARVVVNDEGGDAEAGRAVARAVAGERPADDDGDANGTSQGPDGGAWYRPADVSDPSAVEALFERVVDAWGGVDVLVNNAAVWTHTAAGEATLADWDRVLDTDLRGYWLCARHAAAAMPDSGRVINVSSNHAFGTMPGMFPYNVAKAGVEGLTRALALDLGPAIRVAGVAPGWIRTGHVEAAIEDGTVDEAALRAIHPAGRIGRPEDVAGAVAFLAGPDAGFVTGATLVVDGGRTGVLQDDALEYAGSGE